MAKSCHPRVLSLGEIQMDLVCTVRGLELQHANPWIMAPGGAPANVAVALARLGVQSAFLGGVGTDAFGTMLLELLVAEGVDTSSVARIPRTQTRMSYVTTSEEGNRKLAAISTFASADECMQTTDLHSQLFQRATVLHFGSACQRQGSVVGATEEAIRLAREHNLLLSYDPNVKLQLWQDARACREAIFATLPRVDLVKVSSEELKFLIGNSTSESASALQARLNIPLLVVTYGRHGATVYSSKEYLFEMSYGVSVVDPTGAGDAFVASMIEGLLPMIESASDRRAALANVPMQELRPIIERACVAGALACTQVGGILSMPTAQEIKEYLLNCLD